MLRGLAKQVGPALVLRAFVEQRRRQQRAGRTPHYFAGGVVEIAADQFGKPLGERSRLMRLKPENPLGVGDPPGGVPLANRLTLPDHLADVDDAS